MQVGQRRPVRVVREVLGQPGQLPRALAAGDLAVQRVRPPARRRSMRSRPIRAPVGGSTGSSRPHPASCTRGCPAPAGDRLERAPRRAVLGPQVPQAARLVGQVAQREHGVGPAVRDQRRRSPCRRRACGRCHPPRRRSPTSHGRRRPARLPTGAASPDRSPDRSQPRRRRARTPSAPSPHPVRLPRSRTSTSSPVSARDAPTCPPCLQHLVCRHGQPRIPISGRCTRARRSRAPGASPSIASAGIPTAGTSSADMSSSGELPHQAVDSGVPRRARCPGPRPRCPSR